MLCPKGYSFGSASRKRSSDPFHDNINILSTTECLKMVKMVGLIIIFNHNTNIFLKARGRGLGGKITLPASSGQN